MGKLAWIVQVGPKGHHESLYRKEAERDDTHGREGSVVTQVDWSDETTACQQPAEAGRRMDCPQAPSEGALPCFDVGCHAFSLQDSTGIKFLSL